jgi:hypothetical protein
MSMCNNACVPVDTEKHCGDCTTQCVGAEECLSNECELCSSGCAVMNVTLESEFAQHQAFEFAITIDPPVNLNGATVTARVHSGNAINGQTTLFLDYTPSGSSGSGLGLDWGESSGWLELSVTGTAALVEAIRIKGGAWAEFPHNETNVMYVDYVRVSTGVLGPWEFGSSAAPLAYDAALSYVPGTVSWLKN